MESFFSQTPSITMNLINNDYDSKKSIYDFVCRIERTSPYRSVVSFNVVESEEKEFSARLEVVANSFEILLTKKNNSLQELLKDFESAFNERLKPWLEGRFSA